MESTISYLDLARPYIKAKYKQNLEDRWFLCKYLTWVQNSDGRGMDQSDLIDLLLRFMEEGYTRKDIVEHYEEEIHDGRDAVLKYWQDRLNNE
jgi:hypothetical protein